MPEEGIKLFSHNEAMSLEEIEKAARISAGYGIRKIRLTGGEPLLKKGLTGLCHSLKHNVGIEELCLTTNGTLLADMIDDLKSAGVSRINISLDSLNDEKYNYMTRTGRLADVWAGIDRGLALGIKLKLNTVLIGGFNDSEIPDFLKLLKDLPIELRFIELMKIGEGNNMPDNAFISNEAVLDRAQDWEFQGNQGVSAMYSKKGYRGSFGLISPISSCFCSSCNRIRLTSDGKLKPCLHSDNELSLKGQSEAEMRKTIYEAIFTKPREHNLINGASKSLRGMHKIGG